MESQLHVRLPSGHIVPLDADVRAETAKALKRRIQALAPECVAIEGLRVICAGQRLDDHAVVGDAVGRATLVHAVYVPRVTDVIPAPAEYAANCRFCELTLPFKWVPQCAACGSIAFELSRRPESSMTWADLAGLQGGCWQCNSEALMSDSGEAVPAAIRFTCSNEPVSVPCNASRTRAVLLAADPYVFKPDNGLPGLERVLEAVFGYAAAGGLETALA